MTLVEYFQAQQSALRADVERLVRLESPSTDKAAVDRCGAAVAQMLREAGGTVSSLPQTERGDHVRAEFPGGPGRVLVLGHFDTVWEVGRIRSMPLREEDGRLYGPGVYDMKASIAVAAHAMRTLRERSASVPRVVMLFTTDEEVGSGTSRVAIEDAARDSDAVLVLEPSLPGGAAKTQRKGCGEFTITARGVSAHAGIDPRKGASAIHELAHQIRSLEALQDLERGISVNVGVIRGGTRGNVIAEQATAVVDVRVPTMSDAARVETAIRALAAINPAVTIEVHGGVERPPLERTAGVARLYEQARQVAASLGHDLEEGGTGGGSDGNFTAALGLPTLDGLGPRGDGAHALHEHVVLADLPWRAAFLAALLCRLNG
ncbi:MAG TPA: M20 family metallopeptidase [Vicinamibacterales bacterium]|jgi:glutamate carboxypeptidase|nr:M20 family metallopeptidase [Vicinamibacterales bacterium]